LQTAHAIGEQTLALAQQVQDAAMLVAVHRVMGTTLQYLGAIVEAHTHFTQGLALYDHHQHRASTLLYGEDGGVTCRSHDALTLWLLGYPEQGLTRVNEALTLAQRLAHPYSLSSAFVDAMLVHVLRREVGCTQERAATAIGLATTQGFPQWMAISALLRGWALAQQGQSQEGIAQIEQGLSALRATGAEIRRPSWLALLAEAHGIQGEPEAGLKVLTEALTLVDTTGERWYEAELQRLQGARWLQQNADHQADAETCFHHAISIARRQQAKSWELRAAMSLSRLWQQQGTKAEAHELLAPVYGWFTEGFDTADLQDAKALLVELGG
jgi:predicted ATPase